MGAYNFCVASMMALVSLYSSIPMVDNRIGRFPFTIKYRRVVHMTAFSDIAHCTTCQLTGTQYLLIIRAISKRKKKNYFFCLHAPLPWWLLYIRQEEEHSNDSPLINC